MYSRVQRDEPYRRDLVAHIQRAYGLSVVGLAEATRGYYGETWKLDTPTASYFAKVDYASRHRAVFRDSLAVVQHLTRHGVTAIPSILATADGALYTSYDGAILALFDWIEGDNVENQTTKPAEYAILAQVYSVPTEGVPIPRETFGCAALDDYDALRQGLTGLDDDAAAGLLALLDRKAALIQHSADRLRLFAGRCRGNDEGFHITHGDAGGNIIVTEDGHYLVDWDDPVLAPPERDAWFCMDRAWAMETFAQALRGRGIAYTLNPDRLAYYHYHSFMAYLVEWLVPFYDLPHLRGALLEGVADYFGGWIMNSRPYVDAIA